MKTKKLVILIFTVLSLNTFAQTTPQYVYVHGKNMAGTADSVLYCGDITKIDSIDFRLLPISPVLTSLSANVSGAGTSITLSGSSFPARANCKVFFGDVEGTVTASTANSITVTVPLLAINSSRTTVQVRDGSNTTVSNTINFIAWDATKVFSDNFNRANTANESSTAPSDPSIIGADWLTARGVTAIYNNTLKTTGNGFLVNKNLASIIESGKKFNFSADMMVDATGAASSVGMMFNYTAPVATYNTASTVYQIIRLSGNGLVQSLSSTANVFSSAYAYTPAATTLAGQTWYHFEISSEGTRTITTKVSSMTGTVLMNSTSNMLTPVPGGAFGFFTANNTGYFDNFSLIVE